MALKTRWKHCDFEYFCRNTSNVRSEETVGMVMEKAVLAIFRAYQRFVSPYKPPSCRFHPTCSGYGIQAVSRHGWKRGLWLTVLRLLRCHGLHPGGHDPLM